MEALLRFLEKYELWIYILAGTVGIFNLQRLIVDWREWRGAVFGLERDSAQRRFSTSMTIMILIALFAMAEFILISFISPAVPQAGGLPTPTMNVLATPTATLEVVGEGTAPAPTKAVLALATVPSGNCTPGEIEWSEPKPGAEINGTVSLIGTVNIPDFGFYKYEYSTPSSKVWSTIAAGNQPVTKGKLGDWNTSQMATGDYLLRLVAVDNKNQALPACVIQVRITAPQQ